MVFSLASATTQKILNAAAPIAERFERETEQALVTDLVTSAAKSGPAGIGLGHTLHALNQSRVWQLVYAGENHAPGYECPQCAALFSAETPSRSVCGSAVNL